MLKKFSLKNSWCSILCGLPLVGISSSPFLPLTVGEQKLLVILLRIWFQTSILFNAVSNGK